LGHKKKKKTRHGVIERFPKRGLTANRKTTTSEKGIIEGQKKKGPRKQEGKEQENTTGYGERKRWETAQRGKKTTTARFFQENVVLTRENRGHDGEKRGLIKKGKKAERPITGNEIKGGGPGVVVFPKRINGKPKKTEETDRREER